MQAILNCPMLAHAGIGLRSGQHARADVPGGFAAVLPGTLFRAEEISAALDTNQANDAGPLRAERIWKLPDSGAARLVPVAPTDVAHIVRHSRGRRLGPSAERVEQRGLVALHLDQCVISSGVDGFERFFWQCKASNVNSLPVSPSVAMSSCAAPISPPLSPSASST